MICPDCSDLVFMINFRPASSIRSKRGTECYEHAWKTIRQLLDCDAYQNCDLCQAYVSIVTVERLNEYIRTEDTEEPILVQLLHINDLPAKCWGPDIIHWATFILHPRDFAEITFLIWREHMVSEDFPYHHDSERIRSPTLGNRNAVHHFPSQEVLAETAPMHAMFQSSEGVSWTKPIMDTRGPETVAQMRSWLWRCVSDHPKCRTALSGDSFGVYSQTSSLDQSKLPSRVLDVGSTDSLLVRLVETTTETPSASYVALSHCWGPPDKQPLRTTLNTLEDYVRSGIPFSCLPQTFADAVWVTRELGIRYLWIDSLCIIQDSLSDWEAESQKMSTIYEGATLVLGAAHARDSSEGLFKGLRRPDSEKVVKIYTHMEGHSALAPYMNWFLPEDLAPYMTCFLPEEKSTSSIYNFPWYSSPLAKRAWVMQEWSLSRRFLWSENRSLHWKCRQETKTEPSIVVDLGKIRSFDVLTSNWHLLLQDYSRMQLTYETDRLVALRGIVTALKESYRKEQEYHFGIWLEGHKTLFSLFWEKIDLHADTPGMGLHEIPSWSWASVVGQKAFTLPPDVEPDVDDTRTGWGWAKTRYYYDNRGITASNNGTELHFRTPIGVVQPLQLVPSLEEDRRMWIYITNSKGTNSAVALGCLTLDYTIDVLNYPTPSGITHHVNVIPLVRRDRSYWEKITDYMLVVEPANKPDGSKAYRRVGVGKVEQRWSMEVEWSCWEKFIAEMRIEDIVLV